MLFDDELIFIHSGLIHAKMQLLNFIKIILFFFISFQIMLPDDNPSVIAHTTATRSHVTVASGKNAEFQAHASFT